MFEISDSEPFELFAEELTAEELPSADSYRTSTAACVGTALCVGTFSGSTGGCASSIGSISSYTP